METDGRAAGSVTSSGGSGAGKGLLTWSCTVRVSLQIRTGKGVTSRGNSTDRSKEEGAQPARKARRGWRTSDCFGGAGGADVAGKVVSERVVHDLDGYPRACECKATEVLKQRNDTIRSLKEKQKHLLPF